MLHSKLICGLAGDLDYSCPHNPRWLFLWSDGPTISWYHDAAAAARASYKAHQWDRPHADATGLSVLQGPCLS